MDTVTSWVIKHLFEDNFETGSFPHCGNKSHGCTSWSTLETISVKGEVFWFVRLNQTSTTLKEMIINT